MLLSWKEVSWSNWESQQTNAERKDTSAIKSQVE